MVLPHLVSLLEIEAGSQMCHEAALQQLSELGSMSDDNNFETVLKTFNDLSLRCSRVFTKRDTFLRQLTAAQMDLVRSLKKASPRISRMLSSTLKLFIEKAQNVLTVSGQADVYHVYALHVWTI